MKPRRAQRKSQPRIVEPDFGEAVLNATEEMERARGGDQATLHTSVKLLRALLTASERDEEEIMWWS